MLPNSASSGPPAAAACRAREPLPMGTPVLSSEAHMSNAERVVSLDAMLRESRACGWGARVVQQQQRAYVCTARVLLVCGGPAASPAWGGPPRCSTALQEPRSIPSSTHTTAAAPTPTPSKHARTLLNPRVHPQTASTHTHAHAHRIRGPAGTPPPLPRCLPTPPAHVSGAPWRRPCPRPAWPGTAAC